jgi:hypothetical protein
VRAIQFLGWIIIGGTIGLVLHYGPLASYFALPDTQTQEDFLRNSWQDNIRIGIGVATWIIVLLMIPLLGYAAVKGKHTPNGTLGVLGLLVFLLILSVVIRLVA